MRSAWAQTSSVTRPPAVVDEVARTLSLGQLFAGQQALELKLAEALSSCVSSAELVRIGLSGSEMVQAAMRVARAYTGRSEIIKFEGHYHGWFDNIFINVGGPAAPRGQPRYHARANCSPQASPRMPRSMSRSCPGMTLRPSSAT